MKVIDFPKNSSKESSFTQHAINWYNVCHIESSGDKDSIVHFVDGSNIRITWNINEARHEMIKWLNKK